MIVGIVIGVVVIIVAISVISVCVTKHKKNKYTNR